MFYRIRKLYHPEFYQGPNRIKRHFEGWYYKVVAGERVFALIPGVSRAPEDPHAFIQFIDGDSGDSGYNRYPLDRFAYTRDSFSVSIGDNRFGLDSFSVSIPEISCNLDIAEIQGWPTSLLAPGTMGWYSFVPFMECKHGILVMDARVTGTVDGEQIRDGRLYVEKDYGRSFPNAWIWLQSNSFVGPEISPGTQGTSTAGTSITCSIANVPFVGGAFTGFLAAFLHGGTLHRFTTYTGARLTELQVSDTNVKIVIRDRSKELHLSAQREAGTILASPTGGVMSGRITESIRSSVDVRLVVGGTEVYAGHGQRAGLEVIHTDRLEVSPD